ncbi:S8 family serine peptidase [Actinokineospora sp. HUAS TT18]|uniref:S8 family serine peptidase n=1 Tax=Actinokineospora sp. HUAS TT18 TaxID=3447451 RepID=UPI003F51DBC8
MRGKFRAPAAKLAGLGLAVAAATAGLMTPAQAAEGNILGAEKSNAIEGSYLVVLKDSAAARGVDSPTESLARKYGGQVKHTYRTALKGFAVNLSEAQARKLAADPAVQYVSQDVTGQIDAVASWGIDRVDQPSLPLNSTYTAPNSGSGVHAYIIDTGILPTHTDFGGRATWDYNAIDTNNTDCHGHGTHVAGTIGGATYGLARSARLHGVKAFNCNGGGNLTATVAAIDWVTANAQKPAVANMSFHFEDPSVATATQNMINSGVTAAVAAGNDYGANACNVTPAKVAAALTIGSTASNDAKSDFSNIGSCVDLFAPGSSIISAGTSSNTASRTMSGTSMATPHVAGAVALYLSANPSATTAQVHSAIVDNAVTGKLTSIGTGSPNRLLQVQWIGGGTPGGVTVANPGSKTGTVGTALTVTNSASGGTAPYSWSATGLPAGLSINATNGTISGTPTTAGTSNVTVTATDSSSPAKSGSASFSITINPTGGTCAAQTNGTDVSIPDSPGAAVTSTITLSGCTGNASATSKVEVHIKHTWRGDLVIDLVAPDGTAYRLKNSSSSDSADNVDTTYTVNLSSEVRNGAWKLKVQDVARYDVGNIDTWTLTV